MIGTGLAIFIGSVVLSVLVSDRIKEAMIERAQTISADFVSQKAKLALHEEDFQTSDFEHTRRTFTSFLKLVDTQEILRIKVWRRDGTIIFSDKAEIVGQRFADNENFSHAMAGVRTAVIKPPTERENRFEAGYGQLMEIYVPIRLRPGQVAGVIEVYATLDFVNAEIRKFNGLIIVFNLIAFFGIVLSGMLAYAFLRRTIIAPVDRLREASNRVAAGDFSPTVQVGSEDEIGELTAAFNQMVRDLGESRRRIMEDKDYLDNILTSMNDAVAVIGENGCVTIANRALARLLKYPPGELLGLRLDAFLAEPAGLAARLAGQVPIQGLEGRYRAKDGREIPVLFSASHLHQREGHRSEIVCVAQDISERKAMERTLIAQNQQMQEDLRSAAEFQRAVLPQLPNLCFVDIAVRYLPQAAVSGDIYELSTNREGELCGFLGDATGHGVAAALLTMMLQIGLDSMAQNQEAGLVTRQLNELLSVHDTGKFITGVYFRLSADGLLRAANAAHPPAVILPGNGADCILLQKSGLPLGLFKGEPVSYVEERYRLRRGDKVLLYTDGLTEWKGGRREEFGQERMIACLLENRGREIDEILARLLEAAREFTGNHHALDDLTLMGLQYRGPTV